MVDLVEVGSDLVIAVGVVSMRKASRCDLLIRSEDVAEACKVCEGDADRVKAVKLQMISSIFDSSSRCSKLTSISSSVSCSSSCSVSLIASVVL